MFFHHQRTVPPHIKIELTADRMKHIIRHEKPAQKRLFRNRFVPLRIEPAMVPSGSGIIHIQRQSRINGTPVLIRRFLDPVAFPVPAHPAGRRKHSDGVKTDSLGPFVIKKIFVQPFQRLRISECRIRNTPDCPLIKNHSHQITRLPVNLELSLRTDHSHRVFRHPERSGKKRKLFFSPSFRVPGKYSGGTYCDTHTFPQIHLHPVPPDQSLIFCPQKY